MNVKFLDLKRQNKSIKRDLMSKISGIIDTCAFVSGQEVLEFEEKFAKYCGVSYAVACSSGTSALHLAVSCFPDRKGDALTAPNSFFATSEAISYNPNLKHKFIDVNSTCNMDYDKSLNSVGNKSRFLIPTSLYGNPCDLTEFRCLAKNKDLVLINDAAQAHGALYNNKKISRFANLTCFSFYPGKNLGTCGEGGAVVTNNKRLYNTMKMLVSHGQKEKYIHDQVGYNYRMSEIEAAALNLKLEHIDEWTCKRIKLAERYRANLCDVKGLKMMKVKEGSKCVYHIFPIFVKNRNVLKEDLHKEGIQTGLHYPKPIHLQRAYSHLGLKRGSFPTAENQAYSQLSLPMYPELTLKEVDYVSQKIKNYLS